MNRTFALVFTFAVVVGLSFGLRATIPGSVQAARSGPVEVARARTERSATPPAPKVGPAAGYSALADRDPSELLMARLSHESALCLLEKARRQPGDRRPLEQAACHLRACLAHESTVGEAGTFFPEARQKLSEIENQLALAPKPAPTPPAAGKPSERAPEPATPPPAGKAPPVEDTPEADESGSGIMVSPDGVPIRRVRE
jgi:hypothetical protein